VPQSLAKVLVHLIFSTKNREPLIHLDLRPALHAYLTGTLVNLHCPSLQTGDTADHIHSLFSPARTRTAAEVVEEVKKSSSRWMKREGVCQFAWQAGYGAFSVSESQADRVIRYIARQGAHHRGVTFQEEFRQLLARHKLAYDECFVWD
jgi:putative transposase